MIDLLELLFVFLLLFVLPILALYIALDEMGVFILLKYYMGVQ